MKRRSIGERMAKAGTLAVRREIATDWMTAWRDEHDGLIRDLKRAIGEGRIADAGQSLGQLKAMSDKRFTGLVAVIRALADDDII